MYGVFEEGSLVSALLFEEVDAEEVMALMLAIPEYYDASLYVGQECPSHGDHHEGYCLERPDWYVGSTTRLLRRVRDGLVQSLKEDLQAG